MSTINSHWSLIRFINVCANAPLKTKIYYKFVVENSFDDGQDDDGRSRYSNKKGLLPDCSLRYETVFDDRV